MNALNSILLEGNLVKDPVVKDVSGDRKVANFTIANDRFYKNVEDSAFVKKTSFFDVEAWEKLAEHSGNALKKGDGVRVVGRIKQDRWETEGTWHSRIVVVAEHLEPKPRPVLSIPE